jgi:SAM-dependent methyltransferase
MKAEEIKNGVLGRSGAERLYWDQVVEELREAGEPLAWRSYMEEVYSCLLERWQPRPSGLAMKTDLFEEAVSSQHLLEKLGPRCIGIDVSLSAARSARNSFSASQDRYFVVGDLRRLPLASGSVSMIFSGSSLDHFESKREIRTALSELTRVLSEDGELVISFDNPHNPVVWLRNRLPFALLKKMRLVPYYVGATCSREEARNWLESVGMKVVEETSVAHVPRVPALWMAYLVALLGPGRGNAWFARILYFFEKLELFPTRYLTGYYFALKAKKSYEGQPSP